MKLFRGGSSGENIHQPIVRYLLLPSPPCRLYLKVSFAPKGFKNVQRIALEHRRDSKERSGEKDNLEVLSRAKLGFEEARLAISIYPLNSTFTFGRNSLLI